MLAGATAVPLPANADSAGGAPMTPEETALRGELERATRTADRLRAQLRLERRRHVRTVARVRRSVTRPSVSHALALGAAAYGLERRRLEQVARCESGFNPAARNGRYQGLFQFGPSLWGRTPYRDFDRSDPYAASFAAAWAFSRGMRRHWPLCG
jgi:soluble lytic murein transglycosylase-like protein